MIGVEANRIVYRGDGITTSFPYPFTVLEKADIVMSLVDKERKKKTLTGNYFIDMDKKEIIYPGYAPGEEPAEVERPPALPEGWYLVIQRKTKIDQQTSLGDKWPFDVTEDALDKITRILQDLDTDSKRHLEISVEASGIDPMLPSPKANMGFYWDETGTKLVEGLNPKAASESAAASSAAASTSEKNSAGYMELAKKWAVSSISPDGSADSESTTGQTQSSKTWALYAKAKAAETAERADAAIGAANTAKTYAETATKKATAAGDSQTAAAHSASSAKASADHAGESATIAADNAATATTCAAQASDARDAAIGAKDSIEAAQANAKASATAAANSATSAQESAEKAKGYAAITNPVTSVKEDTTNGGIVVTNAAGDVAVIPLVTIRDVQDLIKQATYFTTDTNGNIVLRG